MKRISVLLILFVLLFFSCKSKKINVPEKPDRFTYAEISGDSIQRTFATFEKAMFPRGYKKLKSISYGGVTVRDGKKIFTRYYHEKNKGFWVKTDYAGQTAYPIIYTPDKKLKWVNGKYVPLTADELAAISFIVRSDWMYMPFYFMYGTEKRSIEKIANIKEIDGRKVKGFSVKQNRQRYNFYFDNKHRFLIRMEKIDSKGDMVFRIDFMDFRPVSGNYLAHYWIVTNRQDGKNMKIIWNTIKINYIETLKM